MSSFDMFMNHHKLTFSKHMEEFIRVQRIDKYFIFYLLGMNCLLFFVVSDFKTEDAQRWSYLFLLSFIRLIWARNYNASLELRKA